MSEFESRGVASVVAGGDRLKSLEALRDRLASAIDECESMRDLAALSARLADVLIQIETLSPPKVEEGDPVDEITARRTARGAVSTAGIARAGKGSA